MKKIIRLFFTLLLLSLISAPAVLGQQMKLDEILDRYYESINQEKLNEVETITATGKVLVQGGAMELPFTMKQKRKNMMRLDAEMQGQNATLMAYDGENGWMLAPWTGSTEPQDLSAQQLKDAKESANIDGQLYNWKEKGHELELTGAEDVEGTATHELKLTKKNGDVDYFYLDARNFVPLKIRSVRTVQGTEVENSTYLSNYKSVNDIMMAFNIETRMNGQTQMEIVIEDIKMGEEIPDSYFTKPKTEEKKSEQ